MSDKTQGADVEGHAYRRAQDERETAEAQSPEAQAELDRRDDEPDVEGHAKRF